MRVEYRAQGVGPLMLAEVRRVAASMVGRYNATVYTDVGNWRHGLDDLVQDVAALALLRDRQAEYLMRQCVTIDDFERLIRRQIKRVLARRRDRTVVDNLIDRSRPILRSAPFELRARHLQETFVVAGADRADRAATFVELKSAARLLRQIPRLREPRRDRAPQIYGTDELRTGLLLVASSLPVAFTVGELDRIFRLTLPDLLPGVLDLYSDTRIVGSQSSERVNNDGLLVDALTPQQQEILRWKLTGFDDGEIASRLGIPRRTANHRRLRVYAIVEDALEPVRQAVRLACLDRLFLDATDY
jgi:hypothetical protein